MNMKKALQCQVQSKYNLEVMAAIGININNLGLSFVTTLIVGWKLTAIREGLRESKDYLDWMSKFLTLGPTCSPILFVWGITSHPWLRDDCDRK